MIAVVGNRQSATMPLIIDQRSQAASFVSSVRTPSRQPSRQQSHQSSKKASRQASHQSSRKPSRQASSRTVSSKTTTTQHKSHNSSRQSSIRQNSYSSGEPSVVDMVDMVHALPPPTPELLASDPEIEIEIVSEIESNLEPPTLVNRLKLDLAESNTGSTFSDSILNQDRTAEIDDWKSVLTTLIADIRQTEEQRLEDEKEMIELSHVKTTLQDQIEELESRMAEDRDNFTE